MNKPELLSWLQKEIQQWEALLDQIGAERMEQPGVNGDWSMKDMVAHLAGSPDLSPICKRQNAANQNRRRPGPRN